MKKRSKLIFGVLLTGLLIYIYFTYNPSASGFFPHCPLVTLTGLKCPGCGSQRAVHALLHGEWAQAFHFNALLVLSLPVIALLIAAEWQRVRRPRFYLRVHQPVYILSYLMLIVLWWILRNVFGW